MFKHKFVHTPCTFKQKFVRTLCMFKQKFVRTLCTFKHLCLSVSLIFPIYRIQGDDED